MRLYHVNTGMNVQAPAKINLGLEVLRRRPDGYHDVNTIYAAVDLCDEVELRPRPDGEIVCRVEGNERLANEPAEENLCVRAARALRSTLEIEAGLTIDLRKRIPAGAGLGGGSSDAAAILRGAPSCWGRAASPDALLSLAAQLGSDVPFFLGNGLAHATSRGEVLRPLDLALPWAVLLVNPGIHISTPEAYGAVNRTGERPASDLSDAVRRGIDDPSSLRGTIVNDFENPIFARYPLLKEIKNRLYEGGAFLALMSGSGSTLFGLFPKRMDAEAARSGFAECWTHVAGFMAPRPFALD